MIFRLRGVYDEKRCDSTWQSKESKLPFMVRVNIRSRSYRSLAQLKVVEDEISSVSVCQFFWDFTWASTPAHSRVMNVGPKGSMLRLRRVKRGQVESSTRCRELRKTKWSDPLIIQRNIFSKMGQVKLCSDYVTLTLSIICSFEVDISAIYNANICQLKQ